MRTQTHLQSQTVSAVELFREHAREPGFVWLDSSMIKGDWGKQSLLAWHPTDELKLPSGADRTETIEFFRKLSQLESRTDLTAVGYIGYEAACLWHGLPAIRGKSTLPLAHFWLYEDVHWFDVRDRCESELLSRSNQRHLARLQPTLEQDEYLDKITRIKRYLHEGDIYQANFTTRFDIDTDLSPTEAYLRLRQINPAPYCAYLEFGDYRVLSSSPERLLHKEGRQITSTPIKGTIERGSDVRSDNRNRDLLLDSAKNRAELLMIIDLVRNDLGRVSTSGSVRVDQLFRAERYSSLIHLVGDVSATMDSRYDLYDLLHALLPAGSITGAPKLRAIEIINELENRPRSVYTGSIGYISGDKVDLNVAIRTMVHQDNVYHVHAGGGIVADSDPTEEYNEMQLKAKNLFKTLGLES